jgi:hypothetical protein
LHFVLSPPATSEYSVCQLFMRSILQILGGIEKRMEFDTSCKLQPYQSILSAWQ